MSWSHLALVTDAEIGALEPEATAAGAPWGSVTWLSQRAEAKRDLKIWLEADFAEIPAVTDRIRDRWPADRAWQYTASVYIDQTTALRDDTSEDVDLSLVFATFGTDALYVGAIFEFDGLFIKLLDSLNANTATLAVKYWDGGAWTAFSATDGTAVAGKTLAKSGRITWTLPTNWERRDVGDTGTDYFWVQVTVSAAITAATAASQVLPLRAPDGLKRVAAYLALGHIFKGLAAQTTSPFWTEQAAKYRMDAETLYARLREHGGIPIDMNLDGVVTPPTETQVVGALRIYRG